jgi:uncharacterized protein (DUF924 family)
MDGRKWAGVGPDEVIDFWFPEDGHDASFESHRAFWTWRMQGGADDSIRDRFGALTEAAATGQLDHWADTPRGRLALIVALDQFSRSVWRGTPGAFGQDIKAARLALEGLENGHYTALPHVWEKAFVLISICHCEGPGHLARMERSLGLCADLIAAAPERLRGNYRLVEDQNRLGRDVIARFGRHPHRNGILGRISTPAEEAYIATGAFPHVRALPSKAHEVEAFLASGTTATGGVS